MQFRREAYNPSTTSPTQDVKRTAIQDDRTGEGLFISQLDLIERVIAFVCVRHRLSPADADDFASHVKLKLIESGYAVLTKFQHRCSPRTYLTVVIQRLFLDYRIIAWGKWRQSAEAKREGPVAMLLERLLVRDGYSFDEACEFLTTNHRVTVGRAELERIAAKLPVRTRRRFESDAALVDVASVETSPDSAVADGDRQDAADRLSAALRRLIGQFDTQDQLIIAMRFEEARTVAEIASVLREDQKALYRRFERLLRQLRVGLETAGFDAAGVMEILESPAVSIQLGNAGGETEAARPSLVKGAQEWR